MEGDAGSDYTSPMSLMGGLDFDIGFSFDKFEENVKRFIEVCGSSHNKHDNVSNVSFSRIF